MSPAAAVIVRQPRRSSAGPEEVLAQQLTQQMSSVYSDDAALVAEEVLAQQLSQQVRRGQAHRQQAAVSAIRGIHNLVLERPQSPQPSGALTNAVVPPGLRPSIRTVGVLSLSE